MSEYITAWLNDIDMAHVREEIVRCKDCKYRADRGRRHYCDAHAGGFFEVADDDFCSWGEKGGTDERA